MTSNNATNIPRLGLSSSAVLFEYKFSSWGGQKLDRQASDEIEHIKKTLTRAGKYDKDLLAGCIELTLIKNYVANARNQIKKNALPWAFSGPVLVPTAIMMDFDSMIKSIAIRFNELVKDFLVVYPTLIDAAAMNLADMFNPNDYPSPDVMATKFGFRYQYAPIPESGDFRVDVSNYEINFLQQQYEANYALREQSVARANWTRLHTELSRLVNQLREDGRIHESTFSGLKELCVILDSFNITRDAELDAARKDILNVLNCTDTKELKKDDAVRVGVREELNDILSKFNF